MTRLCALNGIQSEFAYFAKKTKPMHKIGIAIHGGAGTLRPQDMNEERESLYKRELKYAIQKGVEILRAGGSALEAVEKAVVALEDCELFNAGKGSVFTSNGIHEMDASIMDGNGGKAGAVALLRNVKNPVSRARLVMEKTNHVLLAGEGAELFAKEIGVKFEPDDYFYSQHRYDQLEHARHSDKVILDHSVLNEKKFGTVGAVALDQSGNLAAATSTGGMTNKKYGRIGDSPLIGSGTYASNESCAVSCTGSGEYFIRTNAAFHVSALMKYGGKNLSEATGELIHHILPKIGGDGGLIGIDRNGNISMVFNTEGMYRASWNEDGEIHLGIYS
jgi:beta-aspartyl-peptidase (threonine type)